MINDFILYSKYHQLKLWQPGDYKLHSFQNHYMFDINWRKPKVGEGVSPYIEDKGTTFGKCLRTDLDIPRSRVFILDNFLSSDESKYPLKCKSTYN